MIAQSYNLILANLCLSALLCGLIWTIQLVHYPSFLDVGSKEYLVFQQNHMRNISLLVMPLMLLELAAGIYLLFAQLFNHIHWSVYPATFFLILIWAVTFFIASPLHGRLVSQGYNAENIQKLINANWWRTISWTGRTIIFFFLLWK